MEEIKVGNHVLPWRKLKTVHLDRKGSSVIMLPKYIYFNNNVNMYVVTLQHTVGAKSKYFEELKGAIEYLKKNIHFTSFYKTRIGKMDSGGAPPAISRVKNICVSVSSTDIVLIILQKYEGQCSVRIGKPYSADEETFKRALAHQYVLKNHIKELIYLGDYSWLRGDRIVIDTNDIPENFYTTNYDKYINEIYSSEQFKTLKTYLKEKGYE